MTNSVAVGEVGNRRCDTAQLDRYLLFNFYQDCFDIIKRFV